MNYAFNRKLFIITLIVGLFLTIVASISLFYSNVPQTLLVYGDHITFDNVEQLEKSVDLILVGSPLKDFSDLEPTIEYNEYGRYGEYFTITDIKIDKVIKGDCSTDIVLVSQRVAFDKNNNTLIINEDCSIMEKDKTYILFLDKIETMKDAYSIIGVNQGKFNIDGTDDEEKSKEMENPQYKNLKESVLGKYYSVWKHS